MTETERNQIKGALLKCANENENKPTFTMKSARKMPPFRVAI